MVVEELKYDSVDLNNIKPVEPKTLFDATKYDGMRVKIAEIKQIWVDSHYVDGSYDATATVKTPFIEVVTEVVDTIGEGEGKNEIRASARFTLQKDESGNLVISKHPKAKLWKFMRKMGVTTLENLKGKLVTLTTEPSKDENDDRVWLRIVV